MQNYAQFDNLIFLFKFLFLFNIIKHYECNIIITVFAVFQNFQYVLNRINNINVSINFRICNVRSISILIILINVNINAY
jgi:hypothetical protein